MASLNTVDITCPQCGSDLHVPVTSSAPRESTTPGHVLVVVEPDADYIADHAATCTAVTLANVNPTLLPPHVL